MPTLSADVLTNFISGIFRAAGVPSNDAATVAASLVGSNLRGHDSHGVMRVPQYVGFLEAGEYRADVDLIVLHETPAVVVCDAPWSLGQIQAAAVARPDVAQGEEARARHRGRDAPAQRPHRPA